MAHDDKRQWLASLQLAGTVGFYLAASLLVSVAAGRWLDRTLEITPWGTLAGIGLGTLSGLWTTYKKIMKENR